MIAMEPPNSFDAEVIRDEKVSCFGPSVALPRWARSDAVQGMYAAGQVNGQMIPAYRETPHVDPNTATKLMWRSSSHGRHLALDRRALHGVTSRFVRQTTILWT
jgi:glucose-6-phosphate 1-dehydrogenase